MEQRIPLPRAASTVLLRVGLVEPVEVYLLRRPDQARFAPGAYSFPGGVLDEPDRDRAPRVVRALPGGLTIADLHRRMAGPGPFASPDPATTAALLVCAARELFEEAGVLVARDPSGQRAGFGQHWATIRQAVLDGQEDFGLALARVGRHLAPDDLIYFSHWITPASSRIRFDTHFFLATLPPGQSASHWPGEMASGEWLGLQAALARHERGDLPMLPVQTRHLERFARFSSLDALLAHARQKAVPPVLPLIDASGAVRLPEEVAACW